MILAAPSRVRNQNAMRYRHRLNNPRGLRGAGRAAQSIYFTVAIVFFSIASTGAGSGA